MLIDEFLPEYDFKEIHYTEIQASPEVVFRALVEADLCESSITRWLFRLRGLSTRKKTLSDLGKMNFETLGETADQEILLGLIGKFWTLTGHLQKIKADNFREFDEKDFAKAVWNFALEERGRKTRLTTETRIHCTDAQSRRKFGLYWKVIQPFSALIRKEILKTVRQKAESN